MGGRPRYPTIGHDERVTNLGKRVVVLAPMQPELKAIVKSFGLRPAGGDDVFTRAGSIPNCRWDR